MTGRAISHSTALRMHEAYLTPLSIREVARRFRVGKNSVARHAVSPIIAVWYEAPIMRGVDKLRTLQLLLGLANMTEWWCYKVGVPCRQAEMRDWRKHFLGTSTGGRDALKKAARDACALRGWPVDNDDEADAAGVLDYGLACFGIEVPWRDKHLFGGAIAA